MSRVSASSWGIRFPGLRVLYQGTFVATLVYAAACWYQRVEVQQIRDKLLRGQRPALVLLTKAYRSVSTAALSVLAGVLPADLEVYRAGSTEVARKSASKAEMSRLKRELLGSVLRIWQDRWEKETKGRELYSFFPDVAGRFGNSWIAPDHATSQILTGHGCFNKRLCDMRLRNDSRCECGEDNEDRHHVLWCCPRYAEPRWRMLEGLEMETFGPAWYPDLVRTRANFGRLRNFAHTWFNLRNDFIRSSRARRVPASCDVAPHDGENSWT